MNSRIPRRLLWLASLVVALSVPAWNSAAAQAAPKVAVVVSGDPAPDLRALAQRLDARGRELDSLRWPSDPGLPPALRGEQAPTVDDGLAALRALRRRLGWDADQDAQTLRRIGRGVGVHALGVLRAEGNATLLEVYDVGAGQFYEETLTLDADSVEEALAFIVRRAASSQRRASGSPGAAQTQAHASPASVPSPEQAASASEPSSGSSHEAQTHADEPRPVRAWFRHNWAYLVGGALLAAIGVGYAVSAGGGGGGSGTPSLRFRPGG